MTEYAALNNGVVGTSKTLAQWLPSTVTPGDAYFNNIDGKTLVIIWNNTGAPQTVLFNDVGTDSPINPVAFDPNVEVDLPDGEYTLIGPFEKARFNQTGVSYAKVVELMFSVADSDLVWLALGQVID
jgi:hypothetical protein